MTFTAEGSLDYLGDQDWYQVPLNDVDTLGFKILQLEFDDLDPAEKVRFGSFLGRHFRNTEGLYLHYLDGMLDPRVWRGTERTLADMIAYPGAQAWWATRKHWHTDEFVEFVEKHIGNEPTLYERYVETSG